MQCPWPGLELKKREMEGSEDKEGKEFQAKKDTVGRVWIFSGTHITTDKKTLKITRLMTSKKYIVYMKVLQCNKN